MTIPQTDTDIANQALLHLGQTRLLTNLDSNRGAAAIACRSFFDTMREKVWSEYPWGKSTKLAALALVDTDPNDEWAYSYRYPNDCAFFRRVLSDWRTDAADTRVPYRITKDSAGFLILTDRVDAQGEYTATSANVSRDPAALALAQSFMLAYLVAPAITGSDPFKLGTRAANSYASIVSAAKANDANEEVPDQPPDASWIRSRR